MSADAALIGLASSLLVLAAAIARWRGRDLAATRRQAATALAWASAGVGLALVAYGAGRPADATLWRNLGGAALLVTPVACSTALWRRFGLPLIRGVAAGAATAAAVFVLLLLSLRGPGGGWTWDRVTWVATCVIVAYAATACGMAWTRRAAGVILLTASAALLLACEPGARETGRLILEVRDARTGMPIPSRLEIAGGSGPVVPPEALPLFADCGILPAHNWLPALATPQVMAHERRSLWNPFRETEQFYVDGALETELPPGRYRLRASHGPEFRVAEAVIEVEADADSRVDLDVPRWIDLPSEGWYSADDHLHIPRPGPSFDPAIAVWMAAEDLHVANLLQMGLARDLHITPQHGFGEATAHRRGTTLLVSGQENPRTHILGHSITLGAPRWIDFPDDYLLYPRVWRRAHDLGALNGFAHFGLGGADKGLALWAHSGLLDFLEVENFGFPFYERWYEALNLGAALAPTAGTDYPCVPNLPGRDRFYAQLDGPFTIGAWLEAVRRGKTFVSNGPAIDLTADGAPIGARIELAAPGSVRIVGRVRFDPSRDRVTRLELIERGSVVHTQHSSGSEGTITIEIDWPVEETTWLALRASGSKLGEVRPPGLEILRDALDDPPPPPGSRRAPISLPGNRDDPVAAAHTGAVWVTVAGSAPLRRQDEGRTAAAAWADRLSDLEFWLSRAAAPTVSGFPGRGDGVPADLLESHRRALLEEIAARRAELRLEAADPAG